jgi:hypothetical protein
MALTETQQLRMLERLRAAGEQPVTVGELRGDGIAFPAVIIATQFHPEIAQVQQAWAAAGL